MCRLLLVVDDSEQKLLPLVSARRQNKRGQLFGLSKGERLHGFGVAWLTGRAAGAVVTTRPPSDDLNVRRVLGATSSRLALAFIRSCACDRCPATTYCPASDANAQPFVRGGASGLVVAHVGILHHHRDLMRDGGEAGRRAAAVADCGDAGNSDAAFLYRLVASYYDDFGGDLEKAVRATLDLVSDGPASSLNLVATDKTGRVVACRRRSPGDGQAPPPLFYASTATGALLASAPVRWPGVGEWMEVVADGVVVVEGARVRAAAPVATKPRPWPFVPPPRAPAPRAPAPPSPPRPSAKTDAVGAADARMRAVVARVASANRSGLGAYLAAAKKRRLAALRAGASADDLVASLEAFAAALADGAEHAALVERDRAACASGLAREAAAATGDAAATGANGAATDRRAHDATTGAGAEITDRRALAESQARLYDARYSSSSAAEGQDRAGVEEVHITVARETEAIAAAIADAGRGQQRKLTTVRLLDFGCGNGRCFAACRAAARARGLALDVTAYDVSSGALGAFRRALVDDHGFTADGSGALGDVVAGADRVRFVLGSATAPPHAVEAALRRSGAYDEVWGFDVALSGWGTISAIPDLPGRSSQLPARFRISRQQSFLDILGNLAERLLNVVSSENNFLAPQARFRELRRRRAAAVGDEAARLDAELRLATSEGSFYYEVNGEDYFYSAVSPKEEAARLKSAGFLDVEVRACNVASFRDLLASPRLARLERAVLKLVDGNQHLRLQLLLTRLAEKAVRRRLRRVAPLFDPDRTLVDQCARYLCSYASRTPRYPTGVWSGLWSDGTGDGGAGLRALGVVDDGGPFCFQLDCSTGSRRTFCRVDGVVCDITDD